MNWRAVDDENWVWAGADVIEPDHSLALISLSRGGSDAAVVREFDMRTREFVADGFELPEAKTQPSAGRTTTPCWWAPTSGEGSLTESGYPRIVKRWRRGSRWTRPRRCSAARRTDVSVGGVGATAHRASSDAADPRSIDFFNRRALRTARRRVDPHRRADRRHVSVHRDWLLIRAAHRLVRGHRRAMSRARCWPPTTTNSSPAQPNCSVVFEPDEHTCLEHYAWTRDQLVLVTLVDVASRVEIVTPGSWQAEPVPGIPDNTNTVIVDVDELRRRNLPGLQRFRHAVAAAVRARRVANSRRSSGAPAFFDADDIDVTQHFVTSDDGTSIPYFVVGHRSRDAARADAAGRLRRLRDVDDPGLRRCAGPAVAGPWRHLRAGEHPRRRRVRTAMAHPGDARGPAPGRRGLRRGGKRSR